MAGSTESNKAELVDITPEDDTDRRIAALEREKARYPYSPVFQQTIDLLRKEHPKPKPVQHVRLTMTRDQAQRLYGLLGQITAHSGFDPIFQSLDKANFVLYRKRPKLHFVRDNTLHAEF